MIDYREVDRFQEAEEDRSQRRMYAAAVFGACGRLGVSLSDEEKALLLSLIQEANDRGLSPDQVALIIRKSLDTWPRPDGAGGVSDDKEEEMKVKIGYHIGSGEFVCIDCATVPEEEFEDTVYDDDAKDPEEAQNPCLHCGRTVAEVANEKKAGIR